MKTTWTVLSVACALVVSLAASEALAKGGHSGGSHSSGGHSFSSHLAGGRSTPSFSGNKFSTTQSFHQLNSNKSTPKPTLNQFTKLNTSGGKGLSGKQNLNKQVVSNLNKGFNKYNFGKGWKSKWYPGKGWWGFGWGGWFDWGGYWGNYYCGGYWDDYYCQPWYYNPCYNVCCEYVPSGSQEPMVPDFVPTPLVAHIVNPAENQASLGFAINGQPYSLEAGQSQDVELTDTMVIEFDRGSDDATGRYTLSDGVYTFASTPQGWELYHTSPASLAGNVAAN